MERGLVHIPRHLLHIVVADLPEPAQTALLPLLADLPVVPGAKLSAQLIGPPEITLACLAVVARHIGQGLRDYNLTLAHDRARLHADRLKLIFLDAERLAQAIADGDERPAREAVLFVVAAGASIGELLRRREAAGLASFLTGTALLPQLAHWRQVSLM